MEVNLDINTKEINGVRVMSIKSPSALTSYVAYFSLSGSFAENDQERGIAHFLEHMFFKGTESRTYVDINEDAAMMGADQNAYTSRYETCYHLSCPSVNYEKALELLSDQMFHPTFPEEEIEKERTVIQEERKMYEDDHGSFYFNSMLNDVLNEQMRHNTIGYEETIESFKRDDFYAYKKKYYGANNTILLVVGPQDKEEVFEACAKVLENHTLEKSEVPEVQEGLINDYEYFEIERKGISQCFFSYYFPTAPLAEFKAAHQCMLNALGGGMYSILNTEIREKLGLCYSISVMEYGKNKTDGMGIIHTMVAPENKQLAADKIMECIDEMTKNGIDKKIFECAKAKMLADWCKIMENPKKLANSIAQRTLLGIDIDLQGDYQKVLALTLDEVNAYAKDFFQDKGMGCYVMVPK